MNIIETIEELKGKYDNKTQIARLDAQKNKYKISEAMLELRDNIAMQKLEKEVESAVKTINSKLLSNDKMTEQERDLLLTDRERCEWFIYQFPNAEKVINNIKEFIKKYE